MVVGPRNEYFKPANHMILNVLYGLSTLIPRVPLIIPYSLWGCALQRPLYNTSVEPYHEAQGRMSKQVLQFPFHMRSYAHKWGSLKTQVSQHQVQCFGHYPD